MKKSSGTTAKKSPTSVKILGLRLNSSSMGGVLRLIEQRLAEGKKTFVVTPNPEFLVFGHQHKWFREILNSATVAIPDGIALLWAGEAMKGRNFLARLTAGFWTGLKVIFTRWGKRRVTGTDLMEKLCRLAAKKGWRVYLLGGEPEGVADAAAAKLKIKNSCLAGRQAKLKIWAESGPKLEIGIPKESREAGNWKLEITEKWVREINKKRPTFLFVAFGMGKQEKFIADNWDKLNVKLAMGVGGAFNYLSGRVKRAPGWVRSSGFEWLYRLVREPRRWKRQLALVKFIWLILNQKRSKI